MNTPAPRRGRLLSGTAWNLFGLVLPLLVAVVTIPWLIRLVGLERFGFLSLVWVLVGYASLFDLGIGRALVRTMSLRLANGDGHGAAASGRTGLVCLGLLGWLMAAALALAAPWLVGSVLTVPAALQAEALPATQLLAATLPFVMASAGYSAVLNAQQAFRPLNLVRALFSTLSYAVPLALAAAGWITLPAVVGAILMLRVLGTAALAATARRHAAFSIWPLRVEREALRELLQLGGWMSMSNFVSPLLSQLDRLLISGLVPLRDVGVYAAPFDLLSRLMVVPYAIVNAVFPGATAVQPGTPEARQAAGDLLRWLAVAMFPVMLAVVALAQPATTLWLGPDIGPRAATVLQVLALGVFVNTLAQSPATLIQAAGRPRDMALLHLAELPLFLALLASLTAAYGIEGTAVAASLRMVLDSMAVALLAQRGLRLGSWPWQALWPSAVVMTLLFGAALACRSWGQALGLLVASALLAGPWAWRRLLRRHERQQLVAYVLRRR
ncbi:MAG: oligosaccharide flippase family protein [Betaproteobacteria bacterium]